MDCADCGKCCISHIPYTHHDTLIKTDSISKDVGSNLVHLALDEIKYFSNSGFDGSYELDGIGEYDGHAIVRFRLRNLAKQIEGEWKLVCIFLDPLTKKCRIYGSDFFPEFCRLYPFEKACVVRKKRLLSDVDKSEINLWERKSKDINNFVISIHTSYDNMCQKFNNSTDKIALGIQIVHQAFKIVPRTPSTAYNNLIKLVDEEVKISNGFWENH